MSSRRAVLAGALASVALSPVAGAGATGDRRPQDRVSRAGSRALHRNADRGL